MFPAGGSYGASSRAGRVSLLLAAFLPAASTLGAHADAHVGVQRESKHPGPADCLQPDRFPRAGHSGYCYHTYSPDQFNKDKPRLQHP
ncbi:hypothetical protein NDU88_001692 [Pleurodeles waltl]|uniref:Uncharacterized protein n=1 Tax=Pleurodeles waltl TaxID=8319 RepID=A0AAV7R9U1_PLEWA|nr:hypothetical protein NDU88_001692 [Pleurodeles waltl]